MDAVDLSLLAQDPEPCHVVIAKDQPPYKPLPLLLYRDGSVMMEFSLSEEERYALLRGERIRLWIRYLLPRPEGFPPIAIEVTSESKA